MKKIIITAASFAVVMLMIPAFAYLFSSRLSGYLSKTGKVDANVLIVEGWIPDYAMEFAALEARKGNYDAIVTTGIRSPDLEFLTVGMNGYLSFYPGFSGQVTEENKNHTISVLAKSKMGGKYCAHFTVFVNDSSLAEFSADNTGRQYSASWHGSLSEIDSVMIWFDNDMLDESGDVNLYVREIVIDSTIIPYEFHSVYDIGKLDGKERIVNDYSTVAELARNKLIRLGADPAGIFAFPAYKRGLNRTLSSVISCKKGLKTLDIEITGVNIITLGMHSRRTWLAYKSILDKSFDVGVVAVNEKPVDKEEEFGKEKIIKEFINLIYYSVLLIPFYFR